MSKFKTFRVEIVLGSLEDFRALMHEIFESQDPLDENKIFLQGEQTPKSYPQNMGRWEFTLGGTLQKRGFIIARQLPDGTTKLQFAYNSKFQPIGSNFELDFINELLSKTLSPVSNAEQQKLIFSEKGNRSRIILRNSLSALFNLSELNNLCHDLGINYENLPGTTLEEKARELVDYCYRHGYKNFLIDRCKELRPKGDWPNIDSENRNETSIEIPSSENDINQEDEEDDKKFKKITLDLTEDKLFFMYWTMKFIEGGPITEEDEQQRSWMEFEFKKLLVEHFGYNYYDFQE